MPAVLTLHPLARYASCSDLFAVSHVAAAVLALKLVDSPFSLDLAILTDHLLMNSAIRVDTTLLNRWPV